MRNRHLLGLILVAPLVLCSMACAGSCKDSSHSGSSGAAAAAASARAETPPPAESTAAPAKTSDTAGGEPALIRIEIVRREGPPIKGLVEDGSVLRLQDVSTGKAVAFKPMVHTQPAKVQVFAVELGANGAESMRLLDEADVKIGDTEATPVAKVYSVRILEVIPAT
jgi:hypothetical protein